MSGFADHPNVLNPVCPWVPLREWGGLPNVMLDRNRGAGDATNLETALRQATEAMGGTLGVVSVPGAGNRYNFTLNYF